MDGKALNCCLRLLYRKISCLESPLSQLFPNMDCAEDGLPSLYY
jgi:hypothetical protein